MSEVTLYVVVAIAVAIASALVGWRHGHPVDTADVAKLYPENNHKLLDALLVSDLVVPAIVFGVFFLIFYLLIGAELSGAIGHSALSVSLTLFAAPVILLALAPFSLLPCLACFMLRRQKGI